MLIYIRSIGILDKTVKQNICFNTNVNNNILSYPQRTLLYFTR